MIPPNPTKRYELTRDDGAQIRFVAQTRTSAWRYALILFGYKAALTLRPAPRKETR